MKAIVQNDYGSPDVYELKEIDKPVVKDDDVLVRVHAAGLNAGDYFAMRGEPYMIRMSVGWPKPKSFIPGWDVAGTVEAVGKNVTQFQPGDEVFGACTGTCAEYVCAGEDKFALKPTNLAGKIRVPEKQFPLAAIVIKAESIDFFRDKDDVKVFEYLSKPAVHIETTDLSWDLIVTT
jgi:threonine dehydrogenase-like Zn-dependent dehydrogenase